MGLTTWVLGIVTTGAFFACAPQRSPSAAMIAVDATVPPDPPTDRPELRIAMRALHAGDWAHATEEFARIARDTRSGPELAQTAEYYFALGLERLGFSNAALSRFVLIAQSEHHVGHAASLGRLIDLVRVLETSEPLADAVLAYPEDLVDASLSARPAARDRTRYLLGRRLYARHNYERAIRQFSDVDVASDPRAALLTAMCYVQQRRSVPAVRALQTILDASRHSEKAKAMHDFALLTQADVYASTAIKIPKGTRTLHVATSRVRAALARWSAISKDGPLVRDASWRLAWAHFTFGDDSTALTEVRRALTLPGPELFGGRLLEVQILDRMGKREEAIAVATRHEAARQVAVNALDEAVRTARDDTAALSLLDRVIRHPEQLDATSGAWLADAIDGKDIAQTDASLSAIAAEMSRLTSAFGAESPALALAQSGLEGTRKAVASDLANVVRARLALEHRLFELDLRIVHRFVEMTRANASVH